MLHCFQFGQMGSLSKPDPQRLATNSSIWQILFKIDLIVTSDQIPASDGFNRQLRCKSWHLVAPRMKQHITTIDSHTGGEPTRIIVDGGPDLGNGPLPARVARFKSEFDHFRTATINEPRGSDVLIGGLLCQPIDPASAAAIIYFNTAGYLGMCGHGTIGLLVTLRHLGRINNGSHIIETPVGLIQTQLRDDHHVTLQNVRSWRYQKDVHITVPGCGEVVGDIAWGGNWFFLVKNSSELLTAANVDHLTMVTKRIRNELDQQGITGENGAYIDHVELFAEPTDEQNDSRNFVLCPGGSYDRSPCGTGTSAKLACLAADKKLQPGQVWRQESIIGSVFECSYQLADDGQSIIPSISGQAFITGENRLLLDETDPFCMGIR